MKSVLKNLACAFLGFLVMFFLNEFFSDISPKQFIFIMIIYLAVIGILLGILQIFEFNRLDKANKTIKQMDRINKMHERNKNKTHERNSF